jgi:hypothetical protein
MRLATPVSLEARPHAEAEFRNATTRAARRTSPNWPTTGSRRAAASRFNASLRYSSRVLHDIVDVRRLDGHRLHLRFDDGVEGEVDVARLIEFSGVFEPLHDPAYFAQVAVMTDLGTISWPNGADLDPLVLYYAIQGKAVPDFDDPRKRAP